jgi:hypothetical protein
VDFVVCTLAVKEKKIRAGFDMSDRTIPLLDCLSDTVLLLLFQQFYAYGKIFVEILQGGMAVQY